MVGSPSNIGFYQSIRVGREGVAFERSLRALSFLFDGWSRFDGEREKTFEEPEEGVLRVISFTKLGRHFNKVWNQLFGMYKEDFERVFETRIANDLKDIVTFPSPWKEVAGPHGRQPGIFEAGKGPPIYQIQILFEMQKRGKLPYFQIEPPSNAPDSPAHYKTIIKRGREEPDMEQFLENFTSKEIEILHDWSYSLRGLNGSEIRALGTHVDCRETIADICYEYKKSKTPCNQIIQKLKSHTCFLSDSENIARYTREAFLKSSKNRENYKNARKHMLDNIRNEKLRRAFEISHKDDNYIWDNADVSKLAGISKEAFAIAQYFECVAYFRNHKSARNEPKTKTGKLYQHKWADCREKLTQCKIQSLPKGGLQFVFDDRDGNLKSTIRQSMVEVMMGLGTKMNNVVEGYPYA